MRSTNARKAYSGITGCQLEQLLLAEAALIGRKKTERALIVAADGTVLLDKSGSSDRVKASVPKKLRRYLPDAVATHNHPFCSALSVPVRPENDPHGVELVSDLLAFFNMGLREMRMVCCCAGDPTISRVRRIPKRVLGESKILLVLGAALESVDRSTSRGFGDQKVFHDALKSAVRKFPKLISYSRVRLDLAVAEILGIELTGLPT